MARGTASTAQVTERGTKAAAQTAPTQGRHAGPWGASFDGTEHDGKTPVKGLTFERRWTRPGIHPYDEITWEYRTAGIANESGKSVFEQKDVEVPSARPASSSSSIASSTRSRPGRRPSTTSRPTRTSRPSRLS
jgi:hypothetical protein